MASAAVIFETSPWTRDSEHGRWRSPSALKELKGISARHPDVGFRPRPAG